MLNSNSPKKILLQVTGSIAAFKAVALCSKLVQLGHEVEVVLSEGAKQFVGPASFEGFTRKKAHTSLYEDGKMMAHIDLERWADVILLYPASANTIAKLANGEADTLISALFMAHEFKKPYYLAPAMNQAMFAHPSMKSHLSKLESYGVKILSPENGFLACGETGQGRLIEPEEILNLLESKPTTSKKILITSGGTSEPIDSVRSITNFSTGETGFRLAEKLRSEGHEVTLIQSASSRFHLSQGEINYTTTDQFTHAVKSELEKFNFDFLIHAAAVADYRVDQVIDRKIQSHDPLTLKLIPNEKVIQSVRGWSKNQKLEVISFKLTSNSEMKLDGYDSEWIIHNELKNVNQEKHAGTIYNKDRLPAFQFKTKTELAGLVQNIIKGKAL
jgi:phosphopantothenoylcysteine decarboxylase/phosphopantothenate--cysteine ligase